MSEKHPENLENFLKIFAIFSNIKNLLKKLPKVLLFIQIFFSKFLKITLKLFQDFFMVEFPLIFKRVLLDLKENFI